MRGLALASFVAASVSFGLVRGEPVGTTHPAGSSEVEVCGPIWSHVTPTSPAGVYNRMQLVPSTPGGPLYFASGVSNRMSQRLASSLRALGTLAAENEAVVEVIGGYTQYSPSAVRDGTFTDLFYEGRALNLRLSAGAAPPTLFDMAARSGFNFVRQLDASLVRVAVLDDSCDSDAIDIAFLLDGSGSVSPSDFDRSTRFVKDVVSSLSNTDLRVAVATYSSDLSGNPDGSGDNCPANTQFFAANSGIKYCVCAELNQCNGTRPAAGEPRGDCITVNVNNGQRIASHSAFLKVPGNAADRSGFCSGAAIFGLDGSVRVDLNFTSDIAKIRAAADGALHPSGGTRTSLGIARIAELFEADAAAAPRGGVSKVAVVLTDGQANTGYEPREAAERLRNDGVEVFAIGVGNSINDAELRSMVANGDTQVFEIASFSNLDSLTSEIVEVTCESCVGMGVGTPLPGTVDSGAHQCYEPRCGTFPEVDAVEVAISSGRVNVYVSETAPNPGPLNNTWSGLNFGVGTRTIAIAQDAPAPGSLSITVEAIGGAPAQYTLTVVPRGLAALPSSKTFDFQALEGAAVLPAQSVSGYVFSLNATSPHQGHGFAFPEFRIDRQTGAVTLGRDLRYSDMGVYTVRIDGAHPCPGVPPMAHTVTVTVTAPAELVPVFSGTPYNYRHAVGDPGGTVVGQVTAATDDADASVTYAFVAPCGADEEVPCGDGRRRDAGTVETLESNGLVIDEATGEVTIAGANSSSSNLTVATYEFVVRATTAGYGGVVNAEEPLTVAVYDPAAVSGQNSEGNAGLAVGLFFLFFLLALLAFFMYRKRQEEEKDRPQSVIEPSAEENRVSMVSMGAFRSGATMNAMYAPVEPQGDDIYGEAPDAGLLPTRGGASANAVYAAVAEAPPRGGANANAVYAAAADNPGAPSMPNPTYVATDPAEPLISAVYDSAGDAMLPTYSQAAGEYMETNPDAHVYDTAAGEWEPLEDDSGNTYYHNAAKNETVWTLPAGAVVKGRADASTANPTYEPAMRPRLGSGSSIGSRTDSYIANMEGAQKPSIAPRPTMRKKPPVPAARPVAVARRPSLPTAPPASQPRTSVVLDGEYQEAPSHA